MGDGNDGADAKEEEEKKGTGGGDEGEDDDEGNGKANKSKQQKKKKDEDGGDGKKKAATGAVVLRVDLHCDGCARKVVKAIRAAQGVEGVAADVAGGTVTVTGKGADPWDLKDRIESKTHRPVAFVNPPAPKKKANDGAADGKKLPDDDKAKSKTGDDKAKKNKEPPPESTVVVKIGLHCNGCIDRIKRTAHKIKGVKQVTVDTAKEHVTVKGTMDAKALPDVLSRKLKRDVALVAPAPPAKPKDGSGGGDKGKKKQQQEGGESAADKVAGEQQQGGGGGGGKKKNKNNKQEDGGEEDAGGAAAAAAAQQAFPMAVLYGSGGEGSSASYRVEMLHAPQLFSDENPNACAVM
ncbi:hypothetical protein QYE76_068050 [Lolium multiflorum]|uniref:HMA domain-containing protein n=1 Tax=Lolium multiflorum TaxID=4521 RepID=A0AAD8SDR8_LOLMU|nr:hypothetical protein QYE76_068050 [Lolium multiflorum]